MIPTSLSASALNVAELCLARYKAEQVDRGRGIQNIAANLGTAVHSALETYVVETCLKQNPTAQNLQFLLDIFRMAYIQVYNTVDPTGEQYDDGIEMLTKWYDRTDFANFNVLLCETKESFPVPTSVGPIPFNYIWDRFDQLGPTEFRVVDYKTNRWGIRPEDLAKKIQPRMYALAAAIRAKSLGIEATRIWVQFDMLRHDPVGIVFSRDENIVAWNLLKDAAERIIATPEDEVPETLNSECRFCVRKQICNALQKNVVAGGIIGVTDPAQIVDKRAQIKWQMDGLSTAAAELDNWLLTEGQATDVTEFNSDTARAVFHVRSTRDVDPVMVERVVGSDKFSQYGGKKLNISSYDKMLKDPEIPEEQKAQLRGLVGRKLGEPTVRIEAKGSLEGE